MNLAAPKKPWPLPGHAGDVEKLCRNCQHYRPKMATAKTGRCGNGISGKLETRPIDGCGYGFYPSVERFPLKAGPGGTR